MRLNTARVKSTYYIDWYRVKKKNYTYKLNYTWVYVEKAQDVVIYSYGC